MTPQEKIAFEKRLVRKIDMRIMPIVILAYLLNYLDRTNLGNARTLNSDKPGESLVEILNLKGMRYNIIVAIFFVPYVFLEFPSTYFVKRLSPSRWIARIMVTWGIVTICSAAISNYAGLIAVRIALGIAEAGFFPSVLYYFCFWYKSDERATRMAFFASSVAVAGAFGGAIATGVSYLHGKANLYGWQWLFILEGIPAVLCGIMVWFALPDWPETAKFLTEEERLFAAARLGDGSPKMSDKHFDKAEFIALIKTWQFYAFALCYFFMTNSLNAFGYFAPTLIKDLGYTGARAQLMTVPPNIVGFFVILGNSMHSDRTRERPLHILAALCWVGLGYVLLATVHVTGVRYFAVCCIASTNAAVMPFVAWRSSTVSGATGTGTATAFTVAIANSAGAVAPFLFIASDGPRYLKGNWTCFAMLIAAAFIILGLWYSYGASSQYQTHAIIEGEGDEEEEVGKISYSPAKDGSKSVVEDVKA